MPIESNSVICSQQYKTDPMLNLTMTSDENVQAYLFNHSKAARSEVIPLQLCAKNVFVLAGKTVENDNSELWQMEKYPVDREAPHQMMS